MSKHLLVTGGAGFIGSNFVRMALAERPNWRVTNLDALTYSGNPDNLRDVENNANYRFVHGDICDREMVFELMRDVDMVAHLAAESHVDRSIADSGPFIRSNVAGTQILLDAARTAGVEKFLHVSTDEVYGDLPLDKPELKFTEHTPLAPSSPYSASKAASDLVARAAHHTFGLPVVITRCSNNFGPRQFPEKVIPLFVTNLLAGKKVPLYGDGRNVRDWLHVDDHCEALLAALEKGKSGEVYNIGGDNERSNLELTRSILEIMGKDESSIERVADRLGHDRRYAIDSSKIQHELGWRPTRSAWPGALEATVAWYRDNREWCERIRRGEHHQAGAGT
ncbi:MAG: dTDP-glucose 4,6-dehydratase [Phycisphaeraceae bacterium]|nr:MAG: dTDP-glucose 4,6-dehydratase [Phycisphaeraceae bacterium]